MPQSGKGRIWSRKGINGVVIPCALDAFLLTQVASKRKELHAWRACPNDDNTGFPPADMVSGGPARQGNPAVPLPKLTSG